jgi:hypothetical protein
MNKKEALVVMLDELRKWNDTPEMSPEVALEALKDLAAVTTLENLTPDALGMMGGAVLYLMALLPGGTPEGAHPGCTKTGHDHRTSSCLGEVGA